jgi:glutathione synthase
MHAHPSLCAGNELVRKLRAGDADLAAYVLMQRIKPAPQEAVLVRHNTYSVERTVSELGIFGVYLQVGAEVRINESSGHLLRTKMATSDEGGIAKGLAALDTPYLV